MGMLQEYTVLLLYILGLVRTQEGSSYIEYDYSEEETKTEVVEKEVASLDKPDFASTGGLVEIVEGLPVVLPCQVNSLGGRQTIWSKGSVPLFIGATRLIQDTRLSVKELGNQGGTLLNFTPVSSSDSGSYTCSMADPSLSLSLSYTLTVRPQTGYVKGSASASSTAAPLVQGSFLTLLLLLWRLLAKESVLDSSFIVS